MDSEREAAGESLLRRASRGAAISLAGQSAAQLLRLLGNLVLARLLFPEAFGLMAIVYLVLTGLEMVSNLGIQPAIVRHDRGEEGDFLDTAWTLQLLRGAALWAAGSALAPAIARVYGEPQLVSILPVACAASLLMGATSTKLIVLTRRLTLGRVMGIEIAAQLGALLAMTAIAFVYRSVWALVIGGLVAAAVRLVASHVAVPGPRNRIRWEPHAASELFSFGKWLFVSSFFGFLATQIDVAMLGRLLPLGLLGVYSIGVMLPNLLRDVSSRLIQAVLMPALSESNRQSRHALKQSFESARRVLLPAGLAAALGTAAIAPAFFDYLYDDRYAQAGWIAQLAMLRFWFTYLHNSSGRVLLAVGDSRGFAIGNIARTLTIGAGCVGGFVLAALPGVLVGAGAGALLGYLTVAAQLSRLGIGCWRADVGYTLLGGALAGVALWAPRAAAPALKIDDVAALTVLFAAVFLLPFALWVAQRALREVRSAAPRSATLRPRS